MPPQWFWSPLGVLILLVLYQQFRIYWIERQAKRREELFQIIAENAADMIALVDMKGHRLYNSPAYKRILGYSAAELGETSAFEQIHPEDRFKILEAAREARETGTGRRLEYRIKHKDGSWRVLESQASTIRDERGEVAKMVIVNRDITQRKRAEEQLEHNSLHDPLTGLPNRRLFLDRVQNAFARTQRDPKRQYAVLLANVDRFKTFNQMLGASGGDEMLQAIGQRLNSCLRQSDTVARGDGGDSGESLLARLGDDEFTILIDSVVDPSDALRVARRIQEAVAEPLDIESREVRPAISVGIALSVPTHRHPDDILKDADVAMRRAKAVGGSRCEVFDEAMHTRAEGRLRLESDLRMAMVKKQFHVYYQPVVQLDNRRIVSFEALLRWEHPTQGLISPYRFIEAAEDTGILVSLGHWLMLEACKQLREWEVNQGATEALTLTVNLSARQFADARLAADLQDALHKNGLDPSRLQLEITEAVAAADPKLTVTLLSQLRKMGVGVILDNFGTGASSLRGLSHFPVQGLKIDRSLIREMQTDKGSSEVLELILMMARKMNLRATAEGIESARQVERLRELGCEFGQGYYFSQPLEAKAAREFLRESMGRAAGAAG